MQLLLDLDGTLIDSLPGIRASCMATLDALGHVADPAADFRKLVGPPLPEILRRLLAPYGDDRIDLAVTTYRAHYGESGMYLATVYPGVAQALATLHRRGVPMFLATSKRTVFARPIVQRLGLEQWLQGVYGTEPDGSLDHKADLIATLLRKERLDAGSTIMVGDRSHDMVGARANGIRAVGALWCYGSRTELQDAGAEALLDHPSALAGTAA